MHTTTDFQRRLVALGYLDQGGIDGIFGQHSLDAYNHYRAALGKSPVTRPDMLTLNHDLFPEDQPPLNPKGTIMGNLLGNVFSGLFANLLRWDLVQGYLRSALITVGGWIGLDGYVGADGSKAIIGAVMVIVGVIFQAISNNTKAKAKDVVKAIGAHPEVTIIPASESANNKPVVVVNN